MRYDTPTRTLFRAARAAYLPNGRPALPDLDACKVTLRMARALAALDGSDRVQSHHLGEALQYGHHRPTFRAMRCLVIQPADLSADAIRARLRRGEPVDPPIWVYDRPWSRFIITRIQDALATAERLGYDLT